MIHPYPATPKLLIFLMAQLPYPLAIKGDLQENSLFIDDLQLQKCYKASFISGTSQPFAAEVGTCSFLVGACLFQISCVADAAWRGGAVGVMMNAMMLVFVIIVLCFFTLCSN